MRRLFDERLRRAQQEYREQHRIPPRQPAMPTVGARNGCDTQKPFIRAEALDNFMYQTTPAASDAKGASVSYTNDHLTRQQIATLSGMVSYVLGYRACRRQRTAILSCPAS